MFELGLQNILVLGGMMLAALCLGFLFGCLRAARMSREEERAFNEELMKGYKNASQRELRGSEGMATKRDVA